MITLIKIFTSVKRGMAPGVLYFLSKSLHNSECNSCGHIAISKKAINVIDILLLIIASVLIKLFVMPMLPEAIPGFLFLIIPLGGLVILGAIAPQRCRNCMSTDLRFMSDEEWTEYKKVMLAEEEEINKIIEKQTELESQEKVLTDEEIENTINEDIVK